MNESTKPAICTPHHSNWSASRDAVRLTTHGTHRDDASDDGADVGQEVREWHAVVLHLDDERREVEHEERACAALICQPRPIASSSASVAAQGTDLGEPTSARTGRGIEPAACKRTGPPQHERGRERERKQLSKRKASGDQTDISTERTYLVRVHLGRDVAVDRRDDLDEVLEHAAD